MDKEVEKMFEEIRNSFDGEYIIRVWKKGNEMKVQISGKILPKLIHGESFE